MSLSDFRNHFRTAMTGLGHNEWPDGFNYKNIPDNILDRSFHITSGAISGDTISQRSMKLEGAIAIRLFIKGYAGSADAIDKAIVYGEEILCTILASDQRLAVDVKNINFIDMSVEAIDVSNDNDVMLTVNFIAVDYLSF
jgi:hypothetical protein